MFLEKRTKKNEWLSFYSALPVPGAQTYVDVFTANNRMGVACNASNAVAPMADFVTSCGSCRGRPACLPNSKRCLPLCNDGCPICTVTLQMGVAGNASTRWRSPRLRHCGAKTSPQTGRHAGLPLQWTHRCGTKKSPPPPPRGEQGDHHDCPFVRTLIFLIRGFSWFLNIIFTNPVNPLNKYNRRLGKAFVDGRFTFLR